MENFSLGQLNRTMREQSATEKLICGVLKEKTMAMLASSKSKGIPQSSAFKEISALKKESHAKFLFTKLFNLQTGIKYLDVGHSWVVYWILHGLRILNLPDYLPSPDQEKRLVHFIAQNQSPGGGFSGAPHSIAHLAPTYAAILSLVEIGTVEGFETIDRISIYKWFLSLRSKDNKGSFHMQHNGEEDMRGLYIVVVVSKLLNIDTEELLENVVDHVKACQTYEGGIAAEKYLEAHGGYTYCGLAALIALKSAHELDLSRLLHWFTNRQFAVEGGFNGRTNKVVDSCYSFWQGAIQNLLALEAGSLDYNGRFLYSQEQLQRYLLLCCQAKDGGLIDKPGKNPDFYHTSYSLSGLSLSQNSPHKFFFAEDENNKLEIIDPVYNVTASKLENAMNYFQSQPRPSIIVS